jgi:hypothetical protein
LTKTNVRVGLPKLEGIEEEVRQLPNEPVIEVFRHGEEDRSHS